MDANYDRRASSLFSTLFILIIVIIIFFAALLNENRELAVLSVIVLSLAGGMKLWTQVSGFRIRVSSFIDRKRLFAGDSLSLNISAENGKFLPVAIFIDFSGNAVSGSLFCDKELKGNDTLLWNQRADFHWNLQAKSRGVHVIGPISFSSGDLFGFFIRKINRERQTIQVIVYPRLVTLKPFNIPRRDFFGVPGGKHPVQDPVYILGTSDYHYSRPAKFIHWKASARHCRLQEKIFESTEQEKVMLVVDVEEFVKESAAEAFEKTLEAAASMAVHLKRRGSAVGFAANGAMTGNGFSPVVPISRTAAQVSSILEAMARLRMEAIGPVIEFLRHSVRVPAGATCVYFTYNKNSGTAAVYGYFRRRKAPVVVYSFKDILALTGEKPDNNINEGKEAQAV